MEANSFSSNDEFLAVTVEGVVQIWRLDTLKLQSELNSESGRITCAAFLRDGPPEQIDQFWKLVGMRMQQAVSNEPVWLSTAGLGVSWLHLRIDSRPKYYRYVPYKSPSYFD